MIHAESLNSAVIYIYIDVDEKVHVIYPLGVFLRLGIDESGIFDNLCPLVPLRGGKEQSGRE